MVTDQSPCCSLGVRIIKDFNAIDPEAQPRNIVAWTPVVTEILQGTYDFEAESVSPLAYH